MDYERVFPSNGKQLYYYTRIENIPSILYEGLLSRDKLEEYDIEPTKLNKQEIVEKRKDLDDDQYVHLHFFPRTPFAKKTCKEGELVNIIIVKFVLLTLCQAATHLYSIVWKDT